MPFKPVFPDLEYADMNYKDLYAYGPIPYKQASKENAEAQRAQKKAEETGVPALPPKTRINRAHDTSL